MTRATRAKSRMLGIQYFTASAAAVMGKKKGATTDTLTPSASGVGAASTSASLSTHASSDDSSNSGHYQQNYLHQYHSSSHRDISPHARPPRLSHQSSYNDYQEHYGFPKDDADTTENSSSQQQQQQQQQQERDQPLSKPTQSFTPTTTTTTSYSTQSMSINSSYEDDEIDGLYNDEIQDIVGSNIENFKQKIHRSQGSYESTGIQSAITGIMTIGTTDDSIFGLLEGMKDPHYSPHAHIVGVVGEDDDERSNDDDEDSLVEEHPTLMQQKQDQERKQRQEEEEEAKYVASLSPSPPSSTKRSRSRSRSKSRSRTRSGISGKSQTIFRQKPLIYQQRDKLRQEQEEYDRSMRATQGILRSMLSSCCQNECLNNVDDE